MAQGTICFILVTFSFFRFLSFFFFSPKESNMLVFLIKTGKSYSLDSFNLGHMLGVKNHILFNCVLLFVLIS